MAVMINEDNFTEYFFDIKKHKPQKGQVLARWGSAADFVDGWVKQNVIELLSTSKAGAESGSTILRNLVGAIEKDSIRVAKEIAQDLSGGMTVRQVLDKPYRFIIELFYWVKEEYIPVDDPHWSIIRTVDLTKIKAELKTEK